MKNCPFCGSSVNEEDVFCNQCGKSLVRSCPNCGEQVEINALFCRECGYELDKSMENPKDTNTKEKTASPIYKKWWFWLCAAAAAIGLVLLFSSGGGSSGDSHEPAAIQEEEISSDETPAVEEKEETPSYDSSAVKDKKKAETITEFQETVDSAIQDVFPNTAEDKKSETSSGMAIEDFQGAMDEVLTAAFGEGYYEADLDREKKLYNVYVWIDGGQDALEAAQEGKEEDVTYWNARVGLLLETSKKIKEKLDSEGLSEWSVTLSLLDEFTHDDIYAITKDGYIYYEILEDGKLET